MKKLRLLVFSATFGAGHLRAAEAIIEETFNQYPETDITHVDCGIFLNPAFNSILKSTYIGMIKHTPKLWGKFYYDTARISPDSKLQTLLNNMGKAELLKYINSVRPDLIICTYPTIAGVLAQLRLNRSLRVPLVTVVTDYTVHNQWIHQGVDLYITGCNDVYEGFVDRGVDPLKIQVTGIPVHPRFELPVNRNKIMARLGLYPHLPTFLIMGGAYGVIKNPKQICGIIADMKIPAQAIVVCGCNQKLYKSLDDINHSRNNIVRLGYVNNMEELMTASDVIITKAGGLIVSEALVKRLPLIIYKPIPGQEQENTKFICREGAGIAVGNITELRNIIHYLLQHPEKLEKMQQSAAQALPQQGTKKAVEYILQLVNKVPEKAQMG